MLESDSDFKGLINSYDEQVRKYPEALKDEGAHYTQFMVYDLDGDGKAEVAMKTGDGTIDGKGKVIGDSTKDWRNKDGKILDGPEFFTIFSGETGEALATTDYIPSRGNIGGWGGRGGNGGNDNSGNRVDRFL